MKRSLTSRFTILALPAVLAACQMVGLEEHVPTSAAPDPGAMTCARWLDISEGERLTLADQLVGASVDLLDRIRVRQHRPRGTPRDILIRDVVGSLTKNCEVWPPRERSVGELMEALY
jgi:hypothetical protein